MNEAASEPLGELESVELRLSESGPVVVELIEYSRRTFEQEVTPDDEQLDVGEEGVASPTISATILEFPSPTGLEEISDNDVVVTSQPTHGLNTRSSQTTISARPPSRIGRLESTLGRAA